MVVFKNCDRRKTIKGWEEPTWFHKQNMKCPLLKVKSTFLFIKLNLQTASEPQSGFPPPLVSFQIVIASLSQIFHSLEFKWFALNSECWYYYLFHDNENTLKMKKISL